MDAAGLDVLVNDADDAGDGVKITVGAGGGRATFSVCGFTVRVSAGSEVVITCSSVTVEVVEGAAEVEFGGVVVAVPEGGKAKVSDLGGTVFRIENQGATSVAVTAAGQETTLAPGEEISLSTDTDPDADAGGPYEAVEGSSVQLTGSASGGTAPYDFLWSSIVSLSDPFVAAPTIDAVDDGTLPLSLTVTDANGSTGSRRHRVDGHERRPRARVAAATARLCPNRNARKRSGRLHGRGPRRHAHGHDRLGRR